MLFTKKEKKNTTMKEVLASFTEQSEAIKATQKLELEKQTEIIAKAETAKEAAKQELSVANAFIKNVQKMFNPGE